MEGTTQKGRIIKGISGFYYVQDGTGNVHECKAKGAFKKKGVTPLVGDHVCFAENAGEGYALIEEVLPRKNELTRPSVANVDALLIVISEAEPQADFYLVDKLLFQAEKSGIDAYICVNKTDLGDEVTGLVKGQFSAVCKVLFVSAKGGMGLDGLKKQLAGKCVCLAGQSAVGKSSIVNALDKNLKLETGSLSKKTARGKHTTRQTELLYLPESDIYIVDTPGFSMFDVKDIKKEELPHYYKEFEAYAKACRFSSCMHINEPDCAVKKAVEDGKINVQRYERYAKLFSGFDEYSKNR